jgi:signal transduction histidine kinase
MMSTPAAAPEQDFFLSSLAPSLAQKRLALGVLALLLAAFFITVGPLSRLQPARIDAFIPIYATVMFVNDSFTAVLLFAQFSMLRSPALLAISSGYLFTALMLIPWMLTFPGVFGPTGLLGSGLQSTAWLYTLWHAGFPLFIIAYALLKGRNPIKGQWRIPVYLVILSSLAVTAGVVCAAALLVTAGEPLLPRLMMDPVNFSHRWSYAAGVASLLSAVAAVLLWMRRRSVLDLWLMVVMCAFVIEMFLISFPVPARFSVGWYAGRICGAISGSLVLFVLLYEISTLYARLLRAVLAQRREREARLLTGDAVAASIAHEVKQPLAAMITNANAGQLWLERSSPNLDEAKAAFKRIVSDGHRAGAVIGSIRAMFKKDARTKGPLDVNEVIWEALELMRGELQTYRVAVKAELTVGLPRVNGDRVQLQQVLLNLIANAIDAMAANDGPRVLSMKSKVHDSGGVMVSVEDNGMGVEPKDFDRIFDPRFTTKAHGMGMGLSICRSIIDAHDGQLWAAPNTPNGAAFHFVLPAGTGAGR